ncbi:hypothetical protein SprV_0802494400 [Sparganum proliferum]
MESQCGFRRHRVTTDVILAEHQLQEKCQDMRTQLYSTFEGLTKTFNKMVRQHQADMMARVMENGAASEASAVTNGMNKDRVLAPNIFSLTFIDIVMDS